MASVALIVTASATLSLGQGLRIVIDGGFASGQAEVLNESLGLVVIFILVLTVGTFVRFYFVSWVGERVSADIRMAVFNHLVHLHSGFFEENLPSEIQSRVTTDTTLLQTVIGSSVSIALRNILMFIGGLVLIFITNAKLSLVVLASVPLVVLPVILVSRRVRRCRVPAKIVWPMWGPMSAKYSGILKSSRRSIVRRRISTSSPRLSRARWQWLYRGFGCVRCWLPSS